ncbi:MAG: phosphotransferase [Bacteroidales bacterium]|nr:phosphotransferase [Bacteroidales bacterium]
MTPLESLFKKHFGSAPQKVEALCGSASHRRYFRLWGDGFSVIGVEGTDPEENQAFLTLDRHFASKGIRVPSVLAEEGLCYLQEDLGGDSLFDVAVAGGHFNEDLLCATLAALPKIQVEGAQRLDWSVCYPQPSFDGRMVDFDLNYFKYDYLKLTGAEFNEIRLQEDFDRLKADLLAEPSDTFLYRDFNARNVMVKDGEPWFIDFQGGRRGPVYYDVASFVWQAKAAYPAALREKLIRAYMDALKAYMPVDEKHFRERLRLFVLFRQLQVLGCYGFRGLWEQKPYFRDSIPFALQNLRELLPFPQYPYLSEVLSSLAAPEGTDTPAPSGRFAPSVLPNSPCSSSTGCGPLPLTRPRAAMGSGVSVPFGTEELIVTVYSFSFKKGIPEDASGNGGGYVFDCRGTHNPGKYEEYKQMTGLDQPVIDFLEKDGEILQFLDKVYSIVDAHVQRFLERGFTHLQVSFGCTGGQHRSVYSAEHLAAHLKEKFPVRVHLIHRERGFCRCL